MSNRWRKKQQARTLGPIQAIHQEGQSTKLGGINPIYRQGDCQL